MAEPFLTDDVVAAVMAHMNGDHVEDSAVICRGIGGQGDVESATMTGLDHEGIEFAARTPTGDRTVRIPFAEPITERSQIRAEVARMFHDSVTVLDGDR